MNISFPSGVASFHPPLRNAQESETNFPRIRGYLEAKNYERAQAELIYEFRHDHSKDEEDKWRVLCSFYDTLFQAQGFQRPLFDAFLAFLKTLLPSFPCANDKLIDAIQQFIDASPQLTLPAQIEIFFSLHALCTSPASQERLCTLLNELLQKLPIFNSLRLSLRTAEELMALIQAGQLCLGQAASCLRFLVAESTPDPALKEQGRQILGEIDSHSYFPAQIKATLKQFRDNFQTLFEQTFPLSTRMSVDPQLVRDFQQQVCRQFKENFLDALLALPLAILNLKKIPTEFWVCGSLAREEMVPFSDLEGLFVLQDGPQVEEQGQLFKHLLEWIQVLTVSLGETPTSIEDRELLSLIPHPCRKGFALDSLPNCAVSPLREINASFSGLPLYTLTTLSLLQQEKKLIEQEKIRLAASLKAVQKRIEEAHRLQLQNLLNRQVDEEAKREVQAFLAVVADSSDYKQRLNSLKKRQEQGVHVKLRTIYEQVQALKAEKKRNMADAVANNKKAEQIIAALDQQLDHEETHIFLFSLLKARPLTATASAAFAYQATLKALLDDPIGPAGSTRRQQKVQTLLKLDQDTDDDQSSEARLQKMLSQPFLDLKQTFVKPLVYHLTTLALHFDLDSLNTLDIIAEMKTKQILDPDSAALLQSGVAALYLLRVRLQGVHQRGCDDAWLTDNVQLPAAQLTAEEKRWLEKIWRLILRPLYQKSRSGSPPDSLGWLEKIRRLIWRPVYQPGVADSLPASFSLLAPFGRASLDAIATVEESQALAPAWRDYSDYLLLYHHFDRFKELYYQLSQKESLEPLRQAMQNALTTRRQLVESACPGLLALAHVPNQETGFRYSYWQAYQQLDTCLQELTSATQVASPEGIKVQLQTMAWDGACLPFPYQAAAPTVVTRYLKPEFFARFFDQEMLAHALQGQVQERTALWLYRQYPGSLHRVVQLQTRAGKGLHFKERPTHTALEFAIVSLFYRLFGRGATPSILAKLVINLPNGASYSTSLAISLSQQGTLLSDLIKRDQGQLQLDPQQISEQLLAHLLILPSDAHGGNLMCMPGGGLLSLDLEASFVPLRVPSETKEIAFVSELFCQDLLPALAEDTLNQFQRLQPGPLLTAWLNELSAVDQAWSQLLDQESDWLQKPLSDPQDPYLRQLQSLTRCLLPAGTIARLYQQMVHLQGFFKKRTAPIPPLELLSQLLTCWETGSSRQVGEYLAKRYRQSRRSYLFFPSPASQRLATATGRSAQYSQSATITLRQLIGALPTKEESLKRSPAYALKELLQMRAFYEFGIKLSFQGEDKQLTIQADEEHPLAEELQRIFLSLLMGSQGIVSLVLPHFTLLTDQQLDRLIKNNAATLKVLDLRHCHRLSWAPLLNNREALQQLEELSMEGQHLSNLTVFEIFDMISRPVPLKRLKKLAIKNCTGLHLVALDAPQLEQINIQLTGDLTLRLVGKPRLKRLTVSCQQLKFTNCKGLQWQALEYLHLVLAHHFPLDLSYNDIGDAGAEALARALPQTSITQLNLGANDIGDAGAEALAQVLPQTSITQLNLGANDIGDAGAEALAQVLPQTSITELNLIGNSIGDAGAEALARALPSSITQLNLRGNNIGDAGAEALARALPQTAITQLNLSWNHIGTAGAEALARALPPSITHLNLERNSIGNAGAEALARALPQTPIAWLDLSQNYIGAAGAEALARALPPSITQLNLEFNSIGDTGAEVLAWALPQTSITQLSLGCNSIGAAGAQALARALPQTSITELNLIGNSIGDAGAEALARALPQTSITQLNLERNSIGDAGAEVLAWALLQTAITQLNLKRNNIGDAGAEALARALPKTSITKLYLKHNPIGIAGEKALALARNLTPRLIKSKNFCPNFLPKIC